MKITEQEFYNKIDESIARFKNGKERYNTSPIFHKVVQTLARDGNPYEIIDNLLQIIDDQSKAFEQYTLDNADRISKVK